ncbi:MAG: hypothetical protein R3F19_24770 [Verrucomicrobiales bacterium]
MRSTLPLCLSVVCAVGILTVYAQDSDEPSRPSPRGAERDLIKWQHLAMESRADMPLSDAEFARKINDLGGKGWELVTVVPFTKDGTTSKSVYYFKRPMK